MIKHLVISAGSHLVITYLGRMYSLLSNGIIKYEEIETIWGVSAGSIVSVFFCLNFKEDEIKNYIINKPLDGFFKKNLENICNFYETGGFLDIKFVYEFLTPLFKSKNISPDITLLEFYELNKKDLHVFTTDLNSYKSIDLNYKEYPHLHLFSAIYMSICIPFIYKPMFVDLEKSKIEKTIGITKSSSDNNLQYCDKCYLDGAITNRYPINNCINFLKDVDIYSILSIKSTDTVVKHSTEDNIHNFLNCLILNTWYYVSTNNIKIPNEILIHSNYQGIHYLEKCFNDLEFRKILYIDGEIRDFILKTSET